MTRSYWIPDERHDELNLDLVMEEDHWIVATTVITDLQGENWENSEDELLDANLDAGREDVDET